MRVLRTLSEETQIIGLAYQIDQRTTDGQQKFGAGIVTVQVLPHAPGDIILSVAPYPPDEPR